MAYDLAKVTANGNNLIAQILANKSSLSVDKIEISDTQLPSTTDISTMTSVPQVVQTVSANGFSKNSNTLIISTVVDNSSISADYKAWVFGIWGSDSQNGQSQLIAVITSTNSPDTIPAFSGITPVSYTYKFNIGFSNASQIQFNMIDDSFATNDTVVHTTGDETIDGQKKFKIDPTDSAGNAYAKTVDVNQQLDKKVNIADMRKPASDVAGIEEVNAKQDAIAYTPADDSKVAHLSGANNFDTVPTVDNNPLLLASSLPSDLARTGSDQEFTGKNTFDAAPIDKTTGNPYITKDGVPSDVARTGQAQTFTAAQTFSIAPTITDASKDKGDNQAATMADLKSVINSSWIAVPDDKITLETDETSQEPYIDSSNLIYKVDSENDFIYLAGGFIIKYKNNSSNEQSVLTISIDFSNIAESINLKYDLEFYKVPYGGGTENGGGGVLKIVNLSSAYSGYVSIVTTSAHFPGFGYTPIS